jgi:hypothetical protein
VGGADVVNGLERLYGPPFAVTNRPTSGPSRAVSWMEVLLV